MGDVFQLAEANGPRIRAEYAALVEKLAPDTSITDLSSRTRTSAQISINMRPHVAAALFQNNTYSNIYDVARRNILVNGRPLESELRRLLGKFYTKRVAFDSAMNISTNVVYAALNMGGIGCYSYGPICVIFSNLAATKSDTAYLRADSLLNYVDDAGAVDTDRLSCDLCLSDAVSDLVCIKHFDDPKLKESLSWPQMICNNDVYIEAFLKEKPKADEIHEIRIEKAKYDEMMDLAMSGIYRPSNGDAERALSQDFIDVIVAAKQRRVSIAIIEASK